MSEPMTQDEPDSSGAAHEPLFFLHTSVVTAAAVCAALYLLQRYVLSGEANALALYYLAFIPARIAEPGQGLLFLTSAVTCSLLHASLAHLAVNMVWLAAFGAPLAERIGAARFAGFWVFTALCATAMHFVTHIGDTAPMIGASGVVSGAMGAAARFGFATKGNSGPRAFAGAPLSLGAVLRSRSVITFVLVWALINFVTGVGMTSIDGSGGTVAWQAHIGGFLAGFFGLRLFDIRPQREI
jgi:membrane associated rhomboid family serine protease